MFNFEGGVNGVDSGARHRLADLPVVAEGIEDTADAPGVLGSYLADDGGSGCDGTHEGVVGIFDGEDHAYGSTVESFGAEVLVFGRLVGDPEVVTINGEVGDDSAAWVFEVEALFGAQPPAL